MGRRLLKSQANAMPVPMRLDEDGSVASFEVGGNGADNTLFHVTAAGIVLASSRHGILIDIDWGDLYTATQQGKKIILTWKSPPSKAHTHAIKSSDSDRIMCAIKAANEDHAAKTTFLDSLREEHAGRTRSARHGARTDFGDNGRCWHTTQRPEQYPPLLEPSLAEVIAPRDSRIPASIADKHVWNDAWYDDSKKYVMTYNSMFKKTADFSSRQEQIKHDLTSADGSVSLEGLDVRFLFGYPAVVLSWDGDNGHANAWTLLPTISPEMLTKEMVASKIHSDPSDHNLTYSTDPPGTYVSKFHSPISMHEAVLCDENMREYAASAYCDLFTQLNYLRENVRVPVSADPPGGLKQKDVRSSHNDPNFLAWIGRQK